MLKVSDRCDRCGAQAFLRAVRRGRDLLLCGHHGARHFDALVLQGFIVHDDRARINATPSPSASV